MAENERTFLYKQAVRYRIPANHIVINPKPTEYGRNLFHGMEFIPLPDLIKKSSRSLMFLDQVVEFVHQHSIKKVDIRDLSNYWIEIQLSLNTQPSEILQELRRSIKKIYHSIDDLIKDIQIWKLSSEKQIQRDIESLKQLEQSQSILLQNLEHESSKPLIKSTTYSVKISGVGVENAVDLFNVVKLSQDVPLAILYDRESQIPEMKSEKYIKNLESELVNITEQRLDHSPALYLRVFSDISEKHEMIHIDLETGEMILEIEHFGSGSDPGNSPSEIQIFRRITEALPGYTLSDRTRISLSAEFKIVRFSYFEPYLLDLILNNSIFNQYLYLKELTKPQALKPYLTIYYQSFGVREDLVREKLVTIGLEQHHSDHRTTFKGDGGRDVVVFADDPYVQVTVNRIRSEDILSELRSVLSRLFTIYSREKSNEERYRKYFSPITPVIKSQGKKKITRLSEAFPHIFIKDYSRLCQGVKQQPILIDDVKAWESQTFKYGGNTYHRQAMPYPPNNPIMYLGCNHPDHPFPGVKVNTGDNRKEFPYIPCCYKYDHMNPLDPTSNYNQWRNQRGTGTSLASNSGFFTASGEILKNISPLAPYRLGMIQSSVEKLLRGYKSQPQAKDGNMILRMGVPSCTSSMICCVLEATNNEGYLKGDLDERTNFAHRIREDLMNRVHISCSKQELFDVTDEEIKNQLMNHEVYLDPLLFYRLVEEYFNINIYIIGTDMRVSRPRFKLFHSHTLRNKRPTILLFRHGDENQCDLITDYYPSGSQGIPGPAAIKLFGSKMTNLVHQLLIEENEVITWEIENGSEIVARSHLYSRVDFRELFQSANSMYIDPYGKMRILHATIRDTPFSIFGIPSQPENLPVKKHLHRPSIPVVKSVFGEPTSYSLNENGLVDGLWYRIGDLPNGIYIPSSFVSPDPSWTVGPINPVFIEGRDTLREVDDFRKLSNILNQYIMYFFDVYRNYRYQTEKGSTVEDKLLNNEPIVDSFFRDYVIAVNESNPFERYRVKSYPRLLSDQPNLESAMANYIGSMAGFIESRPRMKIVMYNAEFMNKIRVYLGKYFHNTENLVMKIDRKINVYHDVLDFNSQENVEIFMSENEYVFWYKSQNNRISRNSIDSKLTITRAKEFSTEPYLFRDRSQGINYLVQNTNSGIRSSIQVARFWRDKRINLGYNPPMTDPDSMTDVIEYYINPNGEMKVLRSHPATGTPLEVLRYREETDNYAALLPLV